jgi:hypothetical protein
MAYDLIFGKTRRNWGCGALISLPPSEFQQQMARDSIAKIEVDKLGKLVRDEIQKNFNAILALHANGRIPEADRKAFGPFLKKWIDFGLDRNGKFQAADIVPLKNFREANKRFSERLKVFSQVASTPLKQPLVLAESKELVPFHPPGWKSPETSRPWAWLFALGAGLGFLLFRKV